MGLGAAVHKDGAPVPEPDVIEVQERLGEPTTYRLRYTLSIGEGDFPLLTSGNLDAGARLSVVAEAGKDKTETLVKGPVHGQQIHFDHGGAASWVEVLGSDRSIELDREVRAAIWPDGKPSDAIRTIIGRYAPLQADVEDSPSRFEEQKHALVQRDSDLGFVRRLARRHGALF